MIPVTIGVGFFSLFVTCCCIFWRLHARLGCMQREAHQQHGLPPTAPPPGQPMIAHPYPGTGVEQQVYPTGPTGQNAPFQYQQYQDPARMPGVTFGDNNLPPPPAYNDAITMDNTVLTNLTIMGTDINLKTMNIGNTTE